MMVESNEFMYDQSVRPQGAKDLLLVGFSDGANPAYAATVYYVWTTESCQYSHLMAAKVRINSGKYISTPKSEMNSTVQVCRVITVILDRLVEKPREIVLEGD